MTSTRQFVTGDDGYQYIVTSDGVWHESPNAHTHNAHGGPIEMILLLTVVVGASLYSWYRQAYTRRENKE